MRQEKETRRSNSVAPSELEIGFVCFFFSSSFLGL